MSFQKLLTIVALLCTLLSGCGDSDSSEDLDPIGQHDRKAQVYRRCSVQEPEVQSHSLLLASAAGDIGTAQSLIDSDRKTYRIDSQVGPQGRSALSCAVENEHLELVQLYLSRQANPNQVDKAGNPVLHLAIRSRNAQITELLLANNADPNLRNAQGANAWDEAEYMREPKLLELVQNYGGRRGLGGGASMPPQQRSPQPGPGSDNRFYPGAGGGGTAANGRGGAVGGSGNVGGGGAVYPGLRGRPPIQSGGNAGANSAANTGANTGLYPQAQVDPRRPVRLGRFRLPGRRPTPNQNQAPAQAQTQVPIETPPSSGPAPETGAGMGPAAAPTYDVDTPAELPSLEEQAPRPKPMGRPRSV